MSRKGNCWDDSVMERFFLNLKMERVWQKDHANHFEETNDIADYIVGFYNAVRMHSKLSNLSPNAFERESTSKNLLSCPKLLDHHNPRRVSQAARLDGQPFNAAYRLYLQGSIWKSHPL